MRSLGEIKKLQKGKQIKYESLVYVLYLKYDSFNFLLLTNSYI